MHPITSDISTGPGASTRGPDPLRHAVQVALTIYLMPVLAIVCAIGGASILIEGAARVAGRFANHHPRTVEPDPFRATLAAMKPPVSPYRRRVRV